LDGFLAALKRLSDLGKDFSAGLVGDGPQRRKLEMLVHQLNLEEHITFYGVKSREEVAELLRQADLLALPSLRENQPVAILEALASGLPVVASRIGGIPEVVNPDLGVLIEPGDVGSIANGLIAVMDHLDDYNSQEIARFARANYSYEVIGQKLNQIYTEVIQEYSH
jgi:glycosyltransferase involved in cell wall biosynthesis